MPVLPRWWAKWATAWPKAPGNWHMRIIKNYFAHRETFGWASRKHTLLLLLASTGLGANAAQAATPCEANWQCRDALPQTLDWCHEGQCRHIDRASEQCQLSAAEPGCWLDLQCDDGNPNTVNWCADFDWRLLWPWGDRAPGRCHAAPRDASACEPIEGPECERNWDCSDGNVQTRNWCYQGQCMEALRDQSECVEPDASCRVQRDCRDQDAATVDWCHLGRCYHAPIDGTQCEPVASECEPVMVVLEHTARGAVNNPAAGSDAWKVPGTGYQIRYIRTGDGADLPLTSSYHCFPTDALPGTVMHASVEITHSENSYGSQDASETVAFLAFDQVGCDDPGLMRPSDDAPENWNAIFQDLNDGPLLAEFTATAADQGNTVTVPLNQEGLAALQSAIDDGAAFGLGGVLLTADGQAPGEMERVFQGTDGSSGTPQPSTKLLLTFRPDTCSGQMQGLSPVDVGYFARALSTETNEVVQSFHYESRNQEHKAMPVGNRNIDNPLLGKGNVETRAYSVWDVSGIDNAVSAKLRIWGWQPSLANNFSGAYTSDDPSETIGLFSVDRHSPQQIIEAPYEDDLNHALDIPIFEDLGEGVSYGERVFTIDDELVGLSPAFRADPNTSCDPVNQDPGAPCGKWLEYQLSAQAIAAINATDGLWSVGHAMTTIDANPLQVEWTNNGILTDMDPSKGSYPSYLSPEPQLIIELGL